MDNCPWCDAGIWHHKKLYVNWECRSNYIGKNKPWQSNLCKIRVLKKLLALAEQERSE